MARIGFYAGSFDPLTVGHFSIICEALASCDKVVIGIGVNPEKAGTGLFSPEKKKEMIHASIRDFMDSYTYKELNQRHFSEAETSAVKKLQKDKKAIDVVTYEDLTVDCAIRTKATDIIRGERSGVKEQEAEEEIRIMSKQLLDVRKKHIPITLIKTPKMELDHISSSRFKTLCEAKEFVAASPYVFKSVMNAAMAVYLKTEFLRCAAALGLSGKKVETHYENLVKAYTEGRHHHTLTHVAHCINYINIYQAQNGRLENEAVLILSMFYHDYIKENGKNEELASAEILLDLLKDADPKNRKMGRKIILATKHILTPGEKDGGFETLEEKIASDVDVVILGDNRNYPSYAQHIHQEYEKFTKELYAENRVAALDALSNQKLFKTKFFEEMYLKDAVENMQKERGIWLNYNDNHRNHRLDRSGKINRLPHP